MKNIAEKVYRIISEIPVGKVATYGQIAEMLGNKNLSRAVGNALHRNPTPVVIPCHRVVNSKGQLAEHFGFGGKEKQRELLLSEGVIFTDLGTVNMEKCSCSLDDLSNLF